MCLIWKEDSQRGVVTDNPIEAYKVLIERDGVLTSPVKGFRYEIGKTYEDMLGAISNLSHNGCPCYDRGFHMFTARECAEVYSHFIESFFFFVS